MKNTLICILLLLAVMNGKAQSVSYTYDNDGNCTARVIPPAFRASLAPSSQAPEEEKTGTALPDVITEKDFLIYPNPTHGHFTVEIHYLSHDMKGEAYLYDSNGRLVEEKKIHSHHLHTKLDFNLSHKSEGMYILNIHLGENTFTWKIIKK